MFNGYTINEHNDTDDNKNFRQYFFLQNMMSYNNRLKRRKKRNVLSDIVLNYHIFNYASKYVFCFKYF